MGNNTAGAGSNDNTVAALQTMGEDIGRLRENCGRVRKLMDEGTYKIDSILKVLGNLKTMEKNIAESGDGQVVLQQLSEEQIDSLLEMLKTPAFQNIARQALMRIVSQ